MSTFGAYRSKHKLVDAVQVAQLIEMFEVGQFGTYSNYLPAWIKVLDLKVTRTHAVLDSVICGPTDWILHFELANGTTWTTVWNNTAFNTMYENLTESYNRSGTGPVGPLN